MKMSRLAGWGMVVSCAAFSAWSQIPQQFWYQDYYDGQPSTGVVSMRLQLYTNAIGSSCLYADLNTNVALYDGAFDTIIGDDTVSGSLTNALKSGSVWVEVVVNGFTNAERACLLPSAYAIMANGVKPGGITADMLAPASVSGSHIASNAISSTQIQDSSIGVDDLNTNTVDARYVNAAGDTMTGGLVVNGGLTASNAVVYSYGSSYARLDRRGAAGGGPGLTLSNAAPSLVRFWLQDNLKCLAMSTNLNMYGNKIFGAIYEGDGSGLTNLNFVTRTGDTMTGSLVVNGMITAASFSATNNLAIGAGAIALGGVGNTVMGDYSSIAGGQNSTVSNGNSFIGGGSGNRVFGGFSTIAGGANNQLLGNCSFIGGGYANSNILGGYYGYGVVIGGGAENYVEGRCAAILGGERNCIVRPSSISSRSFIGSGYCNVISNAQMSVIGGGYRNQIMGSCSVIPGGSVNTITGHYAFAAGHFANANNDGTFVWADNLGVAFSSTDTNQFLIRSSGGVGINTNVTEGRALTVAGDTAISGKLTVSDEVLLAYVPPQGGLSMGIYTNRGP